MSWSKNADWLDQLHYAQGTGAQTGRVIKTGFSPLCHSPGVRAIFLTPATSATRKPWDFELSIPQ